MKRASNYEKDHVAKKDIFFSKREIYFVLPQWSVVTISTSALPNIFCLYFVSVVYTNYCHFMQREKMWMSLRSQAV